MIFYYTLTDILDFTDPFNVSTYFKIIVDNNCNHYLDRKWLITQEVRLDALNLSIIMTTRAIKVIDIISITNIIIFLFIA